MVMAVVLAACRQRPAIVAFAIPVFVTCGATHQTRPPPQPHHASHVAPSRYAPTSTPATTSKSHYARMHTWAHPRSPAHTHLCLAVQCVVDELGVVAQLLEACDGTQHTSSLAARQQPSCSSTLQEVLVQGLLQGGQTTHHHLDHLQGHQVPLPAAAVAASTDRQFGSQQRAAEGSSKVRAIAISSAEESGHAASSTVLNKR